MEGAENVQLEQMVAKGDNQPKAREDQRRQKDMSTGKLTFFFHSGSKALGQTTVATLVAFVLVNQTVPAKATRVDLIFAHTTTEESLSKRKRFDQNRFDYFCVDKSPIGNILGKSFRLDFCRHRKNCVH